MRPAVDYVRRESVARESLTLPSGTAIPSESAAVRPLPRTSIVARARRNNVSILRCASGLGDRRERYAHDATLPIGTAVSSCQTSIVPIGTLVTCSGPAVD